MPDSKKNKKLEKELEKIVQRIVNIGQEVKNNTKKNPEKVQDLLAEKDKLQNEYNVIEQQIIDERNKPDPAGTPSSTFESGKTNKRVNVEETYKELKNTGSTVNNPQNIAEILLKISELSETTVNILNRYTVVMGNATIGLNKRISQIKLSGKKLDAIYKDIKDKSAKFEPGKEDESLKAQANQATDLRKKYNKLTRKLDKAESLADKDIIVKELEKLKDAILQLYKETAGETAKTKKEASEKKKTEEEARLAAEQEAEEKRKKQEDEAEEKRKEEEKNKKRKERIDSENKTKINHRKAVNEVNIYAAKVINDDRVRAEKEISAEKSRTAAEQAKLNSENRIEWQKIFKQQEDARILREKNRHEAMTALATQQSEEAKRRETVRKEEWEKRKQWREKRDALAKEAREAADEKRAEKAKQKEEEERVAGIAQYVKGKASDVISGKKDLFDVAEDTIAKGIEYFILNKIKNVFKNKPLINTAASAAAGAGAAMGVPKAASVMSNLAGSGKSAPSALGSVMSGLLKIGKGPAFAHPLAAYLALTGGTAVGVGGFKLGKAISEKTGISDWISDKIAPMFAKKEENYLGTGKKKLDKKLSSKDLQEPFLINEKQRVAEPDIIQKLNEGKAKEKGKSALAPTASKGLDFSSQALNMLDSINKGINELVLQKPTQPTYIPVSIRSDRRDITEKVLI